MTVRNSCRVAVYAQYVAAEEPSLPGASLGNAHVDADRGFLD
jgi:hypothetical protein